MNKPHQQGNADRAEAKKIFRQYFTTRKVKNTIVWLYLT